jgi:hypothetical protein
MDIGGGTGETGQMAQTGANSDAVSVSSATTNPVPSPRLIAGSTGGGAEGNHVDLQEAASPHGSLVRRLCERVGNLQETLDAAWAVGLDTALPPTTETARDELEIMTTESISARLGAVDGAAGLARLEDMLGRLEGQVAASYPLLKTAVAEGGRRDELCVAVGELEQQKIALEAEVRALLEQKQEICSLAFPSGGRIAATALERHVPLRSVQLSGRPAAGVGSVSPVVVPMTVASTTPASSVTLTSGYFRASQAARLSTPPRHTARIVSSSRTHHAENLQHRATLTKTTLQAPIVSTSPPLHAALYVQR